MTANKKAKEGPKKPRKDRQRADDRKAARASGPARDSVMNVRISARKMRVLADVVRGMPVDRAVTTLAFQQRAGAHEIGKAVRAAVANAEKRGMDVDSLQLVDIQIDKSGHLRRFLPRAHGRATPIRKALSQIHVKVAPRE
jgi:large subunit ribosomal protein L22